MSLLYTSNGYHLQMSRFELAMQRREFLSDILSARIWRLRINELRVMFEVFRIGHVVDVQQMCEHGPL